MRALARPGAVGALAAAACVAAVLFTGPSTARAESLRCHGQTAEVGDSRLSLYYKCGEPLLRDSYCAPFYQAGAVVPPDGWPRPAPALIAPGLPCVQVDEWLYERGPGHMTAIVRMHSGVIQSIRYGRSPR